MRIGDKLHATERSTSVERPALRGTVGSLMAHGIELLYVDDDIVVANKPSGLLVHRGWDNDDDVALFRVRDAIGAYVYPVHRLDRATRGALLFARWAEMAADLGASLEAGRLEKRYLALV